MSPQSKASGQVSRVKNALVERCARLVETHPFVWKLAWEAVHRLPFLLPHDQSYKAFRHFIAARPQGLFLDVGANDGISVLSFRKFSQQYRILGMEPNPALEPALDRIKAKDPLFDYKMVGAGAASAKLQFFVPIYKSVVLHTFTSNSEERVRYFVRHIFGDSVADATSIHQFAAELVRIDDLNIDPAIIKIDAEGFDYDVMLGLEKTIERSRPFIATEISPPEYDKVKRFLNERRYVLLVYDINADNFFIDPTADQGTDSVAAGHRNFFPVPAEMLGSLPLEVA